MDKSQIFLWITLFCLLLLLASGGTAFGQIHGLGKLIVIFWTIVSNDNNVTLTPVMMNSIILYILFAILLLYALLSCIFIFLNRNDSSFMEGMFGTFSKFNFIPLICASALFIIGDCFTLSNYVKEELYILSFIFSAVGLGILIPIYLKTDLSQFPTYVRLSIKKGLYPCLMALFIYNICFNFGTYGIVRKTIKLDLLTILDWTKGCSIAFSLIIGIINLVLAFFLNDICLAGMNILIYIGLIIFFFKLPESLRKLYNGVAEGVIDIIIEVLSLVLVVFMIYKYKTMNLK